MGSIGLGNMGSGNTRSFMGDKRVQMVALCDPCDEDNRYGYDHKGTAGAMYFKNRHNLNDARVYRDFREMLDKETELDAITTATPDHWHGIIGIACANKGLDVYGEKPLTRTIEEGRMLANAVHRNGIIWQTGSFQRSNSEFIRTAELVRNGALGKIKLIKVGVPRNEKLPPLKPEEIPSTLDWDMWQGPAMRTDFHHARTFTTWRFVSDYSAGKIADWGAHHLDISQWAMGYHLKGPKTIEPVEVVWQKDGFFDLPTKFHVRFTYEGGEVLEMADTNIYPMGIEIVAEKGTVWADRGRIASTPPSLIDRKRLPSEIRVYDTERSGNHHSAFIDSVLNRRATVTDIETAHRTNTGCLLGEIAYVTGRTINWDWKTEKVIGDPQAQKLCSRAYYGDWKLI